MPAWFKEHFESKFDLNTIVGLLSLLLIGVGGYAAFQASFAVAGERIDTITDDIVEVKQRQDRLEDMLRDEIAGLREDVKDLQRLIINGRASGISMHAPQGGVPGGVAQDNVFYISAGPSADVLYTGGKLADFGQL